MSTVTKEQAIEYLSSLTVIQIAELVKELETKWGVSAAPAAVAVAAAGPVAAAAEAQTEFTLVLQESGANKIAVIKEVRTITGLGLKEAKDLVDGAPKTVKENMKKEDAETAKKAIEAAGGKAVLK